MEGPATSLSIRSFVAARAGEIVSLVSTYGHEGKQKAGTKPGGLAFQHVPKHMRRRAVSHNPRRLPQRLRSAHLAQLTKSSGGVVKKPKKPSRKYRRRPSNLLAEYNRRQKRVKWTETHIWHAKRFHMVEKWGWKIPQSPCDKGYRALHRALTREAAMIDLSYYSLVRLRLKSDLQIIFESSFLPSNVNPTGLKLPQGSEGSGHFYKPNSYPNGYIGHVPFFWGSLPSAPEEPLLFLWLHPSFKGELIAQIVTIFNLKHRLINSTSSSEEKDGGKSIDELKFQDKLSESHIDCWEDEKGHERMLDLEGIVSKIRIIGPRTLPILQEILKPSPNPPDSSNTHFSDLHTQPNGIQSLSVRDPRLFLPQKRSKVETKPVQDHQMEVDPEQTTPASTISPLFDHKSIQVILKTKMSDSELSKRRSELLIPGSELSLPPEEENQVPILLVHSGRDSWDLILPRGWAMSFWISLSYRTVRTFGQRDLLNINLEESAPFSPPLTLQLPDSNAARKELHEEGESLKQSYFGLPPAKRSNFHKLSCPYPFEVDWNGLLQLWSKSPLEKESYFVLRDRKLLESLQKDGKMPSEGAQIDLNRCLVVVELQIIGKGGPPGKGSIICSAINEEGVVQEYEGAGGDPTEKERQVLRQKHQKELAFLRKKRKKLRERVQKGEGDIGEVGKTDLSKYSSEAMVDHFNKEMNNLWIPQNPLEMMQGMKCKPIGFVLEGRESLRRGKCFGVGICAILPLIGILNQGRKVRIRNCRKELIFRNAEISIII